MKIGIVFMELIMKILNVITAISLLMGTPSVLAKKSDHLSQNPVNQDPIIGVWVGSILTREALPGGIAYFALTLNADNTISASTTLSFQQATEGFPGGSYGSTQHGYWRKVGKRCYKVATTEVVNFKDLSNPILPGIPSVRPLIEYTITLAKEGNSFTFEGNESFFEITDPPFTRPIRDPVTGKPLVIPFTGTGARFCPQSIPSACLSCD